MRTFSTLSCLAAAGSLTLCQMAGAGDCSLSGAADQYVTPTTVYTFSLPVQYKATAAYSVQPYLVGNALYTPLRVQLAPSEQAAEASASASPSALQDLLVTLLLRLIDRQLPPPGNQNPPTTNTCTDQRLKAIEDYLKGQNPSFTPVNCRSASGSGTPDEWPGPAAAAAPDSQAARLTEKIDELSERIEALTAAVNRLAEK